VGDFRQLAVWQKSHALTLKVYAATSAFPASERYSLTDQLGRSASSIPSNIAEGCGRNGDPELARFLRISLGSASELEYQLLLAHDLSYLPEEGYASLSKDIAEIKKMIPALINSLSRRRTRLIADD
jgi:four helix bundle protein